MSDPYVLPNTGGKGDVSNMGDSPSAGHSAFKEGAAGCEYADDITCNPPRRSHPGFKAVQAQIAKRAGVGKAAAGAILASATRRASAKAKKANPRLKRVKGAY